MNLEKLWNILYYITMSIITAFIVFCGAILTVKFMGYINLDQRTYTIVNMMVNAPVKSVGVGFVLCLFLGAVLKCVKYIG